MPVLLQGGGGGGGGRAGGRGGGGSSAYILIGMCETAVSKQTHIERVGSS